MNVREGTDRLRDLAQALKFLQVALRFLTLVQLSILHCHSSLNSKVEEKFEVCTHERSAIKLV